MIREKFKPLIYTSVIVTLILCLLAVNYLSLLSHWFYQTSTIRAELTHDSNVINSDVANYLAPLNYQNLSHDCDDKMLTAMRVAEYHAQMLQEFGYVKDGYLTCSASVGVLDKPQKQPIPDIASSGTQIEFTKLSRVGVLPGNKQAMRIKFGHFQAFIKIDLSINLSKNKIATSVLVYDEGKFKTVFSNSPILETPLMDEPQSSSVFVFDLENNRFRQQFCYAPKTCAVVSSPVTDFLYKKRWLLAIYSSLILILFIMLFLKIREKINRYYTLNNQIKCGINNQQVLCYFQPIISNQHGRISSVEVLCRWQDTSGNIHGAVPFINEVIANKQETELTNIVIRQAAKEFRDENLFKKLKLAINCFPQDVASGQVKAILQDCLTPTELTQVVIEITEQQSSLESNINVEIEKLHQLGVKIAIDDFGTGHSNLEQLQFLKADYLKIDKSFILDMLDNELHPRLIKYIIELAEKMELTCVAEGVETKAHQQKMEQLNVPFSQGYYHAKPMPMVELKAYIASLAQCSDS